jgi:hypothetical protein
MVVGVTFAYAPVKTTVSGLDVEFTVTYITLVPTAGICKLLVVYDVVVMLGAVTRFVVWPTEVVVPTTVVLVLTSLVVRLVTVTIAVPVVEVLIVVGVV